ncbi:acyl-CoA thioesterase [Trujillonella humicola]|uniref:acyl-CoA thioesterase n=1 Tax=Trujillonella humicola TaxID=3383699 RepID=UPI003906A061
MTGSPSAGPAGDAWPSLLEILELEEIDRDLYRNTTLLEQEGPLYGGQVAAQALLAAGRTLPQGWLPHSLHGYFLRRGDAGRPTVFSVERDRDGRSFAARRVVAVQGGEVILNMSASFSVADGDDDLQVQTAPDVPGPEGLPAAQLHPMPDIELRRPPQRYEQGPYPAQVWVRCQAELPDDPLLHAGVLTYVSDASSGLGPLVERVEEVGASLDHVVWFHRPVRMDEWVLMDHIPHSVAHRRGWYTGSLWTADGRLAASLAQEQLFRGPARPLPPAATR